VVPVLALLLAFAALGAMPPLYEVFARCTPPALPLVMALLFWLLLLLPHLPVSVSMMLLRKPRRRPQKSLLGAAPR